MPPIDTTTLAAIFSWVWGQYGKIIADKAIKRGWDELKWEGQALAYGRKVQRLYGTMQVLGQPRPVPLTDIYTAVSLLDRPTALSRYTVEEMEAEFTGRGNRYFHVSKEEKRRDGLEIVREGADLFILGKPGAGKTTFLKHVAIRSVNGELGERVPIFVSLKQLSDSGLSVFNYVVKEFDVCDFPDAVGYLERLLKAGKAILLFDGLDEVNVADDERARLIGEVEQFTHTYDQCQHLITCRLAANDYLFQGYIYVEMADFNDDQIREFVSRWFSGDEKRRERRELFLSELKKPENEGLRELARVPLLLALLCLAFEDTLQLSSRRVELYEEALDALLKKWDPGRNIRRDEVYRELSLKRKEQMLAQVAAETFDRGQYFIPKETLARSFEEYLSWIPGVTAEVDGKVVLQAIAAQHGLFYERSRDIYSFAHLTFQEYFTARYVVENEARGTLPRLIKNYADSRYREVFLMTAAQLPDAGAFFDRFTERLAADADERPAVAAFLRQVAWKATTTNRDQVEKLVCRYFYLSLALSLTWNRNIGGTEAIDTDIARVLMLDHNFDSDLAKALSQARQRGFHHALNRAYFLNHTLAIDLNLTSNPYPLLALDAALLNTLIAMKITSTIIDKDHKVFQEWLLATYELVKSAVIIASDLEEEELSSELMTVAERIVALQDPAELSADTKTLKSIQARCGLNFPELDDKDWMCMNRYLGGNLLLLECLEQAAVADREAIKERLLLLPEE